MFLEHRNRTFQGAFHLNPDYVTWYGLAELRRDLIDIKAEASALRGQK
jgi:hydroxylamine dehydrogenase